MKTALKTLLRVVISVVLLWWVIRKVDFAEIGRLLGGATSSGRNIGFFLAAFVSYFIVAMMSALRWHRLLGVQGISLTYPRTLAYYLIGFFYNNFLPTTIGGGAVRAIYAGKSVSKSVGKSKLKESFSSMLVELIIGGWVLIAFAFIAALVWFSGQHHSHQLSFRLLILLLGVFIFSSVLIYLFFERGFIRKFKGLVEKIKVFEFGEKVKSFYNAMHIYRHNRGCVLEVIGLSFVIQLVIGLMNLAIGLALGFKLPVMSYIFYPVIIGLLTTIPITINGIGIREWGYRFFFAQVGLTGSQAVALSLLFYGVGVIGSLSGGVIFPFMRFSNGK